MQTGRKILNLRRDRKISQQDLAKSCDITPSALSKIEAGINSPRAQIIWRLARHLGVTVEYLLDEALPYPYAPLTYREDAAPSGAGKTTFRLDVSRDEKAFIEALRRSNQVAQEVAYSIPELSIEHLRMVHFLVHHARITQPSGSFFTDFEKIVAGPGGAKDAKDGDARRRSRAGKPGAAGGRRRPRPATRD